VSLKFNKKINGDYIEGLVLIDVINVLVTVYSAHTLSVGYLGLDVFLLFLYGEGIQLVEIFDKCAC